MPNRSSETPATTASSRGPCGVVTRSAMSGANRLCIARGVLSSFSFHSSFVLADVGRGEDLLVAHPAGARVVDALGQEVGCGARDARQQQDDRADPDNTHVSSPFVCEANRRHRQKKSETFWPGAPQSGFGALGATPPRYSRSFCASIFFTSMPGTFFRSSTDLNRPCLAR